MAMLRLVSLSAPSMRFPRYSGAIFQRLSSTTTAARPPRSPFLKKEASPEPVTTTPTATPSVGASPAGPSTGPATGPAAQGQGQRYGPLDVDLRPRDQLRPLLPTWNPPPTRAPRPDELEVSTRLRFRLEDRWWAATVREVKDDEVKVGYDGWPSKHDESVPRTSDRLYLHESSHPDYVAPPLPQRYQRPVSTDADGNPLPVMPRTPRPKVYDPEKERLKRALRPPLPFNPEKERLKRLLRGQSAPPLEAYEAQAQASAASSQIQSEEKASAFESTPANVTTAEATRSVSSNMPSAASNSRTETASSTPASPATPLVEWLEVEGGHQGARAFRHAVTGEVRSGPPPTTSWVELLAEGGSRYYWHVGKNETQWERPQ